MTAVSKFIIVVISIAFIILAPLTIFGHATFNVIYDTAAMQDIFQQKGFFDAVQEQGTEGNDIISLSTREAFSELLKNKFPDIMNYFRGDTDELSIVFTADERKTLLLSEVKQNLGIALSEAHPCTQDEEATFIHMKEFTCQPADAQEKNMTINKAMSKITPFLNVNEMSDVNLTEQLNQVFGNLNPVKSMLEFISNIVSILTIVIVLLVLAIIAIKRKILHKASKTIGILLMWAGAIAFVLGFVLSHVFYRIIETQISMQDNSLISGIINDIFAAILRNAQIYAVMFIVSGIALIGIYFYFNRLQKKPNHKKSKK